MILIPFQISETEYSIFLALLDENLERIRAYDPAEVKLEKLPAAWRGLTLREVFIGYATPGDIDHVNEMLMSGAEQAKALTYLSRGFRYRPGAGDHDGPYMSTKPDGSKPC